MINIYTEAFALKIVRDTAHFFPSENNWHFTKAGCAIDFFLPFSELPCPRPKALLSLWPTDRAVRDASGLNWRMAHDQVGLPPADVAGRPLCAGHPSLAPGTQEPDLGPGLRGAPSHSFARLLVIHLSLPLSSVFYIIRRRYSCGAMSWEKCSFMGSVGETPLQLTLLLRLKGWEGTADPVKSWGPEVGGEDRDGREAESSRERHLQGAWDGQVQSWLWDTLKGQSGCSRRSDRGQRHISIERGKQIQARARS